jgi:hypothetical protein
VNIISCSSDSCSRLVDAAGIGGLFADSEPNLSVSGLALIDGDAPAVVVGAVGAAASAG